MRYFRYGTGHSKCNCANNVAELKPATGTKKATSTCTSDPWNKLKDCDEIPIGSDDDPIPIVKAGNTGVKTFGDRGEIMFQREDVIVNIFGIDVTKGAYYEKYFPTGFSSAGYMRYPRAVGAKQLGLPNCPNKYKCLDKEDSRPATYFENHTVNDEGKPISSQSPATSDPGVCRSKCGGGKEFYSSTFDKESCALADLVVWTTKSHSSCSYDNFDFNNTVPSSFTVPSRFGDTLYKKGCENVSLCKDMIEAQGKYAYFPDAYKLFERSEATCDMTDNCGIPNTKNGCVYNASYESMDLDGLKGKCMEKGIQNWNMTNHADENGTLKEEWNSIYYCTDCVDENYFYGEGLTTGADEDKITFSFLLQNKTNYGCDVTQKGVEAKDNPECMFQVLRFPRGFAKSVDQIAYGMSESMASRWAVACAAGIAEPLHWPSGVQANG